MAMTLCVLLWAVSGNESRLAAYEDEVLGLIPEYGGEVLSRVRRQGGADEQPYEVQVIQLPDQKALDDYLVDARRTALAQWRDEAVARSETIPVVLLPLE